MIYELIFDGRFWFFFLFGLMLYKMVWIGEDTEHLERKGPFIKRENPPGSGLYPFWLFWRVNQDLQNEIVVDDQYATHVWRTEPERFIINKNQEKIETGTDNSNILVTERGKSGDHKSQVQEETTIDEQIKETYKVKVEDWDIYKDGKRVQRQTVY